jgi:hypothetical protein
MSTKATTQTNEIAAPAAHAKSTRRDCNLDVGFAGRPPRGRFQQSRLLEETHAMADPSNWPMFVSGALIFIAPLIGIVMTL